MRFKQLGKTDLIVSRICFGCWQLSPRFWGDVPLDPWRAAVRSALDLGVNFIDTADAYGDGYAEETLGDFLAREGLRDRFILATKFYWNFSEPTRVPDTRYEYILESCENSLRRLRTDHIDLYQIHSWDPITRPDEVAAAFGLLKKQGKVRFVGVSNLNAHQMELYQDAFDVDCSQPLYNLLNREVEGRDLPYCLRNRIGVIPYSSLARGLLSGDYQRDQTFTDHRAGEPLFQGKAFQRILDGLDEIRPLAESEGLTLAQFAIRWVLSHPAVTSAIVGVKEPRHIETIAPAAEGELSSRVWHLAAAAMARARREALG